MVRPEPTRDSNIGCTIREILNQGGCWEVIKTGEERQKRTPTIKQSERTNECVESIPEHEEITKMLVLTWSNLCANISVVS